MIKLELFFLTIFCGKGYELRLPLIAASILDAGLRQTERIREAMHGEHVTQLEL
jgi:hypothetical protein